MAYILQIDASPRGTRSISRTLGLDFIDKWIAVYPNDTVTDRDLGFMGITDMNFIYGDSLQEDNEAREAGLAGVREAIQGAIEDW